MEMLIIFIVLTILNVVIQTIKSIATIKCGKWVAALVNAVAYGLYTYVIFFTSCEGLDLHAKALITAFANLVGVFVVKFFEEKARKDKLWEVRATALREDVGELSACFERHKLPYVCLKTTGERAVFNIYCSTQADSTKVKTILSEFDVKYFVSESKTL
jgi:uncharacterized protein YebE (UPF0316 family)